MPLIFECQASLEQIHNLRERQLRKVYMLPNNLKMTEFCGCREFLLNWRKLAKHIHGPLWKCLLAMAGIESEEFLADLQRGFALVGKLPLCEGAAEEHGFEAGMTVNELRENRSLFNQKVLSAVKELPFFQRHHSTSVGRFRVGCHESAATFGTC